MLTLKTPGVYIQEVRTLPPSVAEISTAIPAFLGYTEKNGGVRRISSWPEYEEIYGKAKPTEFTVSAELTANDEVKSLAIALKDANVRRPQFLMYYCVAHYFQNGGGPCYIVPVGNYPAGDPSLDDYKKAVPLLEQEDEPTLVLLTDAVNMAGADYTAVCNEVLLQCDKLKDRFLIVDVPYKPADKVDATAAKFRDLGLNMSDLAYAAAYYPYLETTLTLDYGAETNVAVTIQGGRTSAHATSGAPTPTTPPTIQHTSLFPSGGGGVTITHTTTTEPAATPKVILIAGDAAQELEFATSEAPTLTITNIAGRNGSQIVSAFEAWTQNSQNQTQGFSIARAGNGNVTLEATAVAGVELIRVPVAPATPATPAVPASSMAAPPSGTLADCANKGTELYNTMLYNRIKSELDQQRVTLPPSAAMAGVYARVDRDRGVWKAPANESVLGVIGPAVKVTDEQQEGLNIDPTAGKSINVIRQFIGKGTLVWGARTLAGNDNEWRYVPVRRLFITIEEATKKASAFAVFEPNDATTWLKVKGMIESYLFSLWERGALAGSKAEDAYDVNVGLGKTMTTQDVLEGRLIVEIRVAAVRPAEFIVLRFMHKLQQA